MRIGLLLILALFQSCLLNNVQMQVSAPSNSSNNGNQNASTPKYYIGGFVSGMTGALTINHSGNNKVVNNNGVNIFFGDIPKGTNYNLSISSYPPGQYCSLPNVPHWG